MISLDIIYDDLNNTQKDIVWSWLRTVRPPYVAVFAGSQFDQAIGYATAIRRDLGIKTILRNTGARGGNPDIASDDGIHTRMSPDDWFTRHCLPYKSTGCIVAADNESAGNDEAMKRYAAWQARALDLAGENGIGLSVGKTATGNPGEGQYAVMDALWRGLDKWRTLSIYSPHEYHAQTPQESAGHVNRYKLAWDRCKAIGIPAPVTVIGEYGYLHSSGGGRLDPEWGFRRDHLTGHQAAQADIAYHQDWYKPWGVTVCVYAYCVLAGKWKDLSVIDLDYLNDVAAYNATIKTPAPPPPIPPPAPLPEDELAEALREIRLSINQITAARTAFETVGNALQAALLSTELAEDRIQSIVKDQKHE